MENPVRPTSAPVIPDGTLLIETFGWRPGEGARRLELHLARMTHSARALGFSFDRAAALNALDQLGGADSLRCRLTLAQTGKINLSATPLGPQAKTWHVDIADTRLSPDDPWLYHKTTQRQVYDTARAALPIGTDEMLFLNHDGSLCEGTISNVFLRQGDGPWLTPNLQAGLLPGVLRRHMLDSGTAIEANLTLEDLQNASEVAMGNSLRGLISAQLRL